MDVYSFITTILLFLAETRAASFENVEIKLGRNRFIIPLKVPIFVTRINAVNLADFKLPVPDLLELILQARAVPSTSPPPSHQSLPPDWIVQTEEYKEPYYPEPGLPPSSSPYQPLPPTTKPDSPHSKPYDNNDESEIDSEDYEDKNESNDFNNLQTSNIESAEHLLRLNNTYNQQWPTKQSEDDTTLFQDTSEELQIDSDEQDESFESYNYQNPVNSIRTIIREKVSSETSSTPLFTEEDTSSYPVTKEATRYDTQYSTLAFVEDSSDSEEGEINYNFNPISHEDRTTSQRINASAEDKVISDHTPSSIQYTASYTTRTLLDDIATTESTLNLAEDTVISHHTTEFTNNVSTPDCATEFPKYAITTHLTMTFEEDNVTSEPTTKLVEDKTTLDDKYSFAKDEVMIHPTLSMEDDIITSTHPLILVDKAMNLSSEQILPEITDTDYITIAPEQDTLEQRSHVPQTLLPTIKQTTDVPGQLLPKNTPATSCDPYTATDNLMTSYSDEDTNNIAAEISTSTQNNEKNESLSTMATDNKNKHESELSLAKSSRDMTTNEFIETSSLQYTPDVSSSLASTDLHVQDIPIETSSSLTTVDDGSETWSPGIYRRSTTTESYTLNDLSKNDTSTETSMFSMLNAATNAAEISSSVQNQTTFSSASYASTDSSIQKDRSTITDDLVSSSVVLETLIHTPGTLPLIQTESTVPPTSDTTTSFPIQEISTISDSLVSSSIAPDTLIETPGTSPLIQNESTILPTSDTTTSFPIQEIQRVGDGLVYSSIAPDTLIETPGTSPLIQTISMVSPASDTTTRFSIQEISTKNDVYSSSIRSTSTNSSDTSPPVQYKTTTLFTSNTSTDSPRTATEASMPLSSDQDVAINTSEISSQVQYTSTVSSASVELPVKDISPETPVPQSLVLDYTTNASKSRLSVKSTHVTTSATNTTLVQHSSDTAIATTASSLPARNTTVSTTKSSRPALNITEAKKRGAGKRLRRRKKRPCQKDKPKIIRRRRRRRRRSTTPLPRVTTRRSTTQRPNTSSPNITDSTALSPNDWNTNVTNSATPGHKDKPKKIRRRRRRRRRSTTPLPRARHSTTQRPKTSNSNITDSTTLGPNFSDTNVKNSATLDTSSRPNTTLPRNT